MIRWLGFVTTCVVSVNLQAGFWGPSLSEKAERAQNALSGLDELVEKALVDFNVPGMAIGVVVDGHTVWSKGYGYRDLENKIPVTAETLFAVGSFTKAFTTFGLGTLVEEGLIDWDQPVLDIMPDFRLWDAFATRTLTLRDLVTHRSGIPRHDFMWYNSTHSRSDLFRRLQYLEPTCNIRERYNYGNLTYLAAGLAMEKIQGKSWEEQMSEKILRPLGMKSSNFSVEEMKNSGDFSYPYLERKGLLRKIPFRDFYNVAPAAALNSNVTDLASWMKMLLAGGTYDGYSLISPALIQEMFAAQVIVSGYVENKDAQFNAYGLGWCIHSYRGHYYISHDGAPDGFTSVMSLLPYDNIGVVVLSNKNLMNLPRYLSLEIADRILELPSRDWLKEGLEQWKNVQKTEVEEEKIEELHCKKGTYPSHPLEEYEGKYEHPGYGIVEVVLQDGKLEAIFNGIPSQLDHWHYDVFSLAEDKVDLLISRTGMKFTFQSNLNGDIDELSVPFEPKAPPIVFKKKLEEKFSNLEYFRQFLGTYEIYNVTVEIAVRNRTLIAMIPGQPIFELIPVTDGEFSVKSMLEYTIRFVKDASGKMSEVLLVSPYGAFTATKKS